MFSESIIDKDLRAKSLAIVTDYKTIAGMEPFQVVQLFEYGALLIPSEMYSKNAFYGDDYTMFTFIKFCDLAMESNLFCFFNSSTYDRFLKPSSTQIISSDEIPGFLEKHDYANDLIEALSFDIYKEYYSAQINYLKQKVLLENLIQTHLITYSVSEGDRLLSNPSFNKSIEIISKDFAIENFRSVTTDMLI